MKRIIFFAWLYLISCQSSTSSSPKNESKEAGNAIQSPSDNNSTANNNANASANAPAGSSPFQDQSLTLQRNHPTGVIFALKSIRFTDQGTEIGVDIMNGSRRKVILNRSSNHGIVLEDNAGNAYPFLPPTGNGEVELATAQSLRGNFNFAGRLAPDANKLTLTINKDYGDQTSDVTTFPQVIFEIPLQKK